MGGYPVVPQFQLPGSGGRKLNSDGTIDVICLYCEKPICRQMYRGFSTATCIKCQGLLAEGLTPQEIIERRLAEEKKEEVKLYNDLGPQNFRVLGFGQGIREMVQKIKKRVTGKKRSLFSGRDEKPATRRDEVNEDVEPE